MIHVLAEAGKNIKNAAEDKSATRKKDISQAMSFYFLIYKKRVCVTDRLYTLFLAYVTDYAVLTLRLPCMTAVSSVKDQTVMSP